MGSWFSKILALPTSRRFVALVAALLVVFLQDVFGLTEVQAASIVGVISSWILGNSISPTGKFAALRKEMLRLGMTDKEIVMTEVEGQPVKATPAKTSRL